MKVYIAICMDRHIDPIINIFRTLEKAIDCCKEYIKDMVRFPEDIKESIIDGWLYYCDYSVEHDYVYVIERELSNP